MSSANLMALRPTVESSACQSVGGTSGESLGLPRFFTALGSGNRVPGRVAPGDCSPRASTNPSVPSRAYGSSGHELAITESPARGGETGAQTGKRVACPRKLQVLEDDDQVAVLRYNDTE